MTLDELLQNEELRQEEFPVTRDLIFLGHAGVSPLPRRVADAVNEYALRCTKGDQEMVLPETQISHARELAARLIGAEPTEIAFVGPTSLALSYVAAGFKLRKNDNILVYFDDYPSNVYPWMALAERGVEVRFLKVRELGRIQPVDVANQIDEQTRLVALASCHFVSGWRIELDAIGSILKERGIPFCVDGIQTVGAFPTLATHMDFLAADAHKWLLGPCAAGILYVRQHWQEHLRPMMFGWHNVRCPNYVAQEELVLRKDARRYEAGTQNLLGLIGLSAALEMLHELGVENIARELLRKRSWLIPELQAKGYTVLNADAPASNASGIIAFFRDGAEMGSLHEKLTKARIVTSLRADRTGMRYVRLSPHFYNTDAELRRVLEVL